MELDDLRQRWRQQPTEPTPTLTPEAVEALLAQPSSSPLLRIRRNVRWEAAIALLCLPIATAVILLVPAAYPRIMAGWLLVICAGSLYYLYQKRRALDPARPAGALRQQLEAQVGQLRRLVQLYYRGTMLSLFGSFGIGFVLQLHKFSQTAHGPKLALLTGVLVVGYGLIGWVTYGLLRRFTHWYLQRLYGQHLDRLESYLHDLQTPE